MYNNANNKKLFNKDTAVPKLQIPSFQPTKEIHPMSKDDSSIEKSSQEGNIQFKKKSAPDTFSIVSLSPKSPKSDDSSGSDEEIDLSVSPRSPKNSPKLPKNLPKLLPLRFPLPPVIVREIFKYVINLEENSRLNDSACNDLLMFYNNKEENRQLLKTALLCLQALIGSNKSAEMSYDPLVYADPEKLFQMFSESKEIQKYFSNALSQLNQIEDLLDKGLVENLAKELSVFENGNYIESIASTVTSSKITSLINKDNIKEIINLLQLPAFDAKKIQKIKNTLDDLMSQCNQFESAEAMPYKTIASLVFLIIALGCGVGSYFSAQYNGKNDDTVSFVKFLSVMLAIIGVLSILASCGFWVIPFGSDMSSMGACTCRSNKNELERSIRSLSDSLQKIMEIYKKFYIHNKLLEVTDLEGFSKALYKNIIAINDALIKRVDRKNHGFANSYRTCGMFRELSQIKIEINEERIDLGINQKLKPNIEEVIDEKSFLLN